MTCQYADLLFDCEDEATHLVRWRWWGNQQYCQFHFLELTDDDPDDYLEAIAL